MAGAGKLLEGTAAVAHEVTAAHVAPAKAAADSSTKLIVGLLTCGIGLLCMSGEEGGCCGEGGCFGAGGCCGEGGCCDGGCCCCDDDDNRR